MRVSARLTTTQLDDRITPRAGDIDLTFGTNGTAAFAGLSGVTAALAQPNGTVYVAGPVVDSTTMSQDMGVVRLTAAGVPDPTFGTNGLAVAHFPLLAGGTSSALPLALTVGFGTVVLVGSAAVPSSPDAATAVSINAPAMAAFDLNGRLSGNSNGNRFVRDGIISFPWGDGLFGQITDVAIRPDLSLVVAGVGLDTVGNFPAIEAARFLLDGRFDPAFDGDDRASLPVGANGRALEAAVAADGGVYGLVGRTSGGQSPPPIALGPPPPFTRTFVLDRLTPSGTADAAFGANGEVTVATLSSDMISGETVVKTAASLQVGPAGRPTVLFPNPTSFSNSSFAVYRYLPNGQADAGFGVNGVASAVGGSVVSVLPDGRLAGLGVGTITRYTLTGQPDATFGGPGNAVQFAFGRLVGTPDGGVVLTAATAPVVAARFTGDDPPPAGIAALGRSIVAGSESGGVARTLNPVGATTDTVFPFANYTGALRTATADFNGDGTPDLVIGSGPGSPNRMRLMDGATGSIINGADFAPFEASYTGGVYVAAGDLTGDGFPELIVTPDEGGGPRVDVYTLGLKGLPRIASFFGIDDVNFRGGARPAVGDVNGDGRPDLIVAAGFGGGPRVAVFDGRSVVSSGANGSPPPKLFNDFFAFEPTLRNGVFVAAGDTDGDGFADLIAGGGPGGGPRVTAFSGKSLLSNVQDVRANFFGGDATGRGGIRVAVKNLDGDARADLVVGAGTGAGSRVTAYFGKTIGPSGTPAAAFDFDAFPGSASGVFVG